MARCQAVLVLVDHRKLEGQMEGQKVVQLLLLGQELVLDRSRLGQSEEH
jgi:hypothetical protein